MLQSRHWAILSYAGLTGAAIIKDIINTPEAFLAVLAPIAGVFAWDKIASSKKKT